MSDIFGRRWFLIVGSIVALCGAVVGATASSVNQLIASGVLFGFGECSSEISVAVRDIFGQGAFINFSRCLPDVQHPNLQKRIEWLTLTSNRWRFASECSGIPSERLTD